MARTPTFDHLRDSNFWLLDVAPIDAVSLPIFTPIIGFNTVSAPEITLDVTQISEGNSSFSTRQVVKGASVGNVTMTRGVTFFDSDFWRWTIAAARGSTGGRDTELVREATGNPTFEVGGLTYRRSLLLIHFFRNFGFPGVSSGAGNTAATIAGAAVSGGTISTAVGFDQGTAAGVASAVQLAAMEIWAGISGNGSVKVPARAFLLRGCIPVRYKTGGDFDASSGQVSIQELEVAVESVEEISLAA